MVPKSLHCELGLSQDYILSQSTLKIFFGWLGRYSFWCLIRRLPKIFNMKVAFFFCETVITITIDLWSKSSVVAHSPPSILKWTAQLNQPSQNDRDVAYDALKRIHVSFFFFSIEKESFDFVKQKYSKQTGGRSLKNFLQRLRIRPCLWVWILEACGAKFIAVSIYRHFAENTASYCKANNIPNIDKTITNSNVDRKKRHTLVILRHKTENWHCHFRLSRK